MPRRSTARLLPFVLCCCIAVQIAAHAGPFALPTANRHIFEPGQEEKFFVPTVVGTWESGTFGCVRTSGAQFHEGLDIRCLQRDKRGEPLDAVMASADGTVAYINRKSGLSNYGNYIVLRHSIEGIEVFTLYAHLSKVQPGLNAGDSVKSGETIGVMGYTGAGISRDRAHVHFEINLFVNEGFAAWHKKNAPGQRNDHGQWNGQNLLGLDPAEIFLEQKRLGEKFSLLQYIRKQPVLCRVLVRDTTFSWLKRYAPLIRNEGAPAADQIAGYEIALNFNGVPVQLTPRSAAEIPGKSKFQLLSVNETEQRENRCRKLVEKSGGKWRLTTSGENLLQLLTY